MRFEKVKRFEDSAEISLPVRATKNSAGYDFAAAENILIPSIITCQDAINIHLDLDNPENLTDLLFNNKPYQPRACTLD
jgi:dUTP pyrophosphatase